MKAKGDTNKRGKQKRKPPAKGHHKGTPQGETNRANHKVTPNKGKPNKSRKKSRRKRGNHTVDAET